MRNLQVAALHLLLLISPAVAVAAPRWSVQEIVLQSEKEHDNPYAVDVQATMRSPSGESMNVQGFWDGGRTWRIRWNATDPGTWTWKTASSDPAMNGRTGTVVCDPKPTGAHGFLRRNPEHPYSFVFDDGTHYFLFGNTGYAIVANAIGGGRWKEYVDKTSEYGMNKMRFYVNRATDPSRAELSQVSSDPERPAVNVWQRVDEIVRYMGSKGMIADLILFQRAQVNALDEAGAKRYLKYAIARYGAFPNVIWCLQNEWQYTNKPHEFWTTMGQFVSREDPWARRGEYVRGLSVHQQTRFDWEHFGESWYSHVIVQLGVRNRGKAHRGGDEWNLPKDRRGVFPHGDDWGSFSITYNYGRSVPVVNDEYGYIGEPLDETERGAGGKPVRYSREKHRRTMWGIYVSGGYGSAGNKEQYGDGRPYVSANWHDEPEFGDIRHLIRFFQTRGFAYWKMSPQPELARGERVYVLTDKEARDYIVYAAAGGKFSLTPPAGTFEAHRFDPRTGHDELIGKVIGGRAAEFTMPDSQDWVVYLSAGQPLSK